MRIWSKVRWVIWAWIFKKDTDLSVQSRNTERRETWYWQRCLCTTWQLDVYENSQSNEESVENMWENWHMWLRWHKTWISSMTVSVWTWNKIFKIQHKVRSCINKSCFKEPMPSNVAVLYFLHGGGDGHLSRYRLRCFNGQRHSVKAVICEYTTYSHDLEAMIYWMWHLCQGFYNALLDTFRQQGILAFVLSPSLDSGWLFLKSKIIFMKVSGPLYPKLSTCLRAPG